MVRYVKSVVPGDGLESGTTMGPVQNLMQYDRLQGFFADIEEDNGCVAIGGKSSETSPGYFINPTIIDNPKEDSRIVVEEPFGKLKCLFRCDLTEN